MNDSSRYRLHSSAFARADDESKITPKKVIFLSVEGNNTERCYFEHLGEYLSTKKQVLFKIEVLWRKRNDGHSSPKAVLELLQECVSIRSGDVLPANSDLFNQLREQFSSEQLSMFMHDPSSLQSQIVKGIDEELLKIGISFSYRRYLRDYYSEGDIFAIVIDRDKKSNSRQLIEDCILECRKQGYSCYLTNPCFEFWLLLHLCDVKQEYNDKLDLLLDNPRQSNAHTYVSKEVSDKASHGKRISASVFKDRYFPKIVNAKNQSEEFATRLEDIIDCLGTNLRDFFTSFDITNQLVD